MNYWGWIKTVPDGHWDHSKMEVGSIVWYYQQAKINKLEGAITAYRDSGSTGNMFAMFDLLEEMKNERI